MRPFVNLILLAGCLLASFSAASALAETPRKIDVKRLSKNIDDVVVPLPNEIFGALNKLDSVNWKEFVRTNKGTNFTERPRIALLLGAVIADGFIAVQAEDAPSVKEIGQRVVSLAKGIGVGNSILPHAKAITEAADRRNWPAVRQELDRTQNSVQQAMNEVHDEKLSQLVSPAAQTNELGKLLSVQQAMNEVHDEKLSQLVSLGGWLRGTQVLTSVVNRHFSADGAELLHQPDLLEYFQRKLATMPEFNVPVIAQIKSSLQEVKPLIETENPIAPVSVKKINEITSRIDGAIVTRNP